MKWLAYCWIIAGVVSLAAVAQGQAAAVDPMSEIRVCPGAFPTDLTSTDCRYKLSERTLDFVSGSATDQAVLGAVVFGFGAQVIESPSEWKRTSDGYGRRVGSRYTQALGKGAAQYFIGMMLNDDPRFLAYRFDRGVIAHRRDAVCALAHGAEDGESKPCINVTAKSLDVLQHDGWQRFGHAWYDVVTVRRSSIRGGGHRIPAFSRFGAEFAGAYSGYPWYPGTENTFSKVGQRAAGAFGTAVLSSFYAEYKPEITNLLGALFRRGRQPKTDVRAHQ